MKKVIIGDFGSIWDAITETDPFEICWEENSTCVVAPGWGSWGALIIVLLEIVFWAVALRIFYKKMKARKEKKLILSEELNIKKE